jgi:hypothetical protein
LAITKEAILSHEQFTSYPSVQDFLRWVIEGQIACAHTYFGIGSGIEDVNEVCEVRIRYQLITGDWRYSAYYMAEAEATWFFDQVRGFMLAVARINCIQHNPDTVH